LFGKVVRVEDRRSAMITGELSIKYEKGILVKPINTKFPIYAFTKKRYAEDYVERMRILGHYLMILRCEATRSKSKSLILSGIVNLGYLYNLSFEKILELMKNNHRLFNASSEYQGTIKCNSITPLE
jgi:hypothetical protein